MVNSKKISMLVAASLLAAFVIARIFSPAAVAASPAVGEESGTHG